MLFSQKQCQTCPLHSQRTASSKCRMVSLHPDESLLQELRQRQTTALDRLKLRERISVEHSLAHIGQWQGVQARYLGWRKNLFDLGRMAVVHNLHVLSTIFTERQLISV
ncbi:transposase [Microcoleus sp. S28C3]|uniref:transposase n=1 Tax=Microcoleus sp. S28C3 TaxID=3055414 RepID=UPI002FD07AB8